MSEFCNQIFFYDNPPIELSQIISSLQPYMLTGDKMLNNSELRITSLIEKTGNKLDVSFTKKETVYDTITPNKRDSLFWCLYILAHGYNDFQQIRRNHMIRKLDVQKEAIRIIQKDKTVMKQTNMKFTNIAIQEVLSDLLSINGDVNYQTAMSLCVLYKFNIYMLDCEKNSYLKFIPSEDNDYPMYLIKRDESNIYSVDIEPLSSDRLEKIENDRICLESYLKPMKTISNYKIDDLSTLASRMNLIDNNTKYKKKELYELVYNKIRWH